MRRTVELREPAGREVLICFALLRQMETPCQLLRDAYQRLIEAASCARGLGMQTVILDWLEAELTCARAVDEGADRRGAQLMAAAIALSIALRQ